jgi:hypothetical protein
MRIMRLHTLPVYLWEKGLGDEVHLRSKVRFQELPFSTSGERVRWLLFLLNAERIKRISL